LFDFGFYFPCLPKRKQPSNTRSIAFIYFLATFAAK